MDWVNAVVFLAGSACLTVVLTFGGVIYSFQSATVIALWVITGVLLITFIALLKLHPLVSKENRLYPLHFFKNPTLINMQLQVFLSSGIILVRFPTVNAMEVKKGRKLTALSGYDVLHPLILPICQGICFSTVLIFFS